MLATLAFALVAAPALYFVHAQRLKDSAAALLGRANELEAAGRPAEAIPYFQQYSMLRPDDLRVHVRIALAYDAAQDARDHPERAIRLFYRAVGVAPDRTDLRRRLVELLLEQRRWSAALDHADILAASPLVADRQTALLAKSIVAIENAGQNQTELIRAFQTIESAQREFPADPKLASLFAVFLRDRAGAIGIEESEAANRADSAMDTMVSHGESPEDAHLRRFAYRRRYRIAGAEEDIQAALRLGNNSVAVMLAAGDYFLSEDRADRDAGRAADCFRRALELAPRLAGAYLGLGRALLASDNEAAAESIWKRGQANANDPFALHCELFRLYLSRQDIAAARAALDQAQNAVATQSSWRSPEGHRQAVLALRRLEAQLSLAEGETNRALPLLLSALKDDLHYTASDQQSPAVKADRVVLAQTYAAMRCWDSAAAELEQLASNAPGESVHHVAAAMAWRQAGAIDRAIASLERARRCADASPHVWLYLAQAYFDRQAALPARAANRWAPVVASLDQAKRKLPDAWEVGVLEAEFVAAADSSKTAAAVAILQKVEHSHENERPLLRRLPLAYEQAGSPAEADRAMARLEQLEPSATDTVLAAAELLAARGRYDEAESRLVAALAAERGPMVRVVQERRIRLALQAGRLDAARRVVDEVLVAQPVDMEMLRRAIDLAAAAKDWQAAARYEEMIRAAEGNNGLHWRLYRARRLLLERRPDAATIAEVRDLAADAKAARPGWPAAALVSGLASEIEGDTDAAIAEYSRAIELGERGAGVYQRLVSLLLSANRLTEAGAVLEQMTRGGLSTAESDLLAIELYARGDQTSRAVEAAREAAARDPNNPLCRVWLGNMLAIAGKSREAQAEFREALRISPDDLRAWSALFTHFRIEGDLERAEKTLEAMCQRPGITDAQRAFLYGQGLQLLGKDHAAEQQFIEALRHTPDDVPTLMQLAAIQANRDTFAAQETLRKILSIDPTIHVARRTLATILATTQGEAGWQEAQNLLADAAGESQAPADNDRLRALLLARRTGDNQRQLKALAEARTLMESRLAAEGQTDVLDRLILAEICERQGRLKGDPDCYRDAERHLLWIAARPTVTLSHLQTYVAFLLRVASAPTVAPSQGAQWLRDADRHLLRIEHTERNAGQSPSAKTLALRVALLRAQKRNAEIPALLDALCEPRLSTITDRRQRAEWMDAVAQLYEAQGEYAAAETWYRKAHDEAPGATAPLAAFLVRRNRLAEAIDVCQAAMKADTSSATAISLFQLVVAHRVPPAELQRIEPALAASVQNHPRDVGVLFSAALVRTVAGQTGEAIELFERVVRVDPKHVLALNNLATLLGEQKDRRHEALRYVDQAMRYGGRLPMLLDTKGTIHLLDANPSEAIVALSEAVDGEAADARYWLHLAAAHHLKGDAVHARSALVEARRRGLDRELLTASDARLLEALDATLDATL